MISSAELHSLPESIPVHLIVGGWGGTVVGLSSIDGMDASENETTITESLKWTCGIK